MLSAKVRPIRFFIVFIFRQGVLHRLHLKMSRPNRAGLMHSWNS